VAKLRDVVELYLSPREREVVFSFDKKSQIQELDRTQPGLPLKKGRAGTMTHDYKRHGTTLRLLRWRSRRAPSSKSVCRAIGIRNSSDS
jgi:hypothetical protein